MIERLNRTYKASYRPTNGFANYDGANYDLALWVAYYFCIEWSGTVVKGTVEYRSGNAVRICRESPLT